MITFKNTHSAKSLALCFQDVVEDKLGITIDPSLVGLTDFSTYEMYLMGYVYNYEKLPIIEPSMINEFLENPDLHHELLDHYCEDLPKRLTILISMILKSGSKNKTLALDVMIDKYGAWRVYQKVRNLF